MQEFTCFPIGVIRSPFKETSGMPIQAKGAEGISGSVELYRKFVDGLKDLQGFSHVRVAEEIGWFCGKAGLVNETRADGRFK